jgi:hypothetical protein
MAKLLGALVVATVVAGCVVDPVYNDGRYGRTYNRPYDDGYDYGHDPRRDYDHSHDHDRDDNKLPTIVCASKDGRPKRCHTDFAIKRAEVDKRYSGSPCQYGRSWGYDGNEVWVDRGCRARFRLTPAGRWR